MNRGRLADMPGVPLRIFLTLWLVYCTHFATDFVREHFLVLSIVDDGTVQLDPYYGIHPDIFLAEDGHAYHNSSPGVSVLATLPYFVLRPAVDAAVAWERARRGPEDPAPAYDDPREARRAFYRTARENGWDVRFGLVGLVTAIFFMAPLSAASAVILHGTLRGAGLARGEALAGTFLYALGTPIFFRTGFLNQNLAVAAFSLMAFCLLWDPGDRSRLSVRTRHLLAGLLGGLALFCDYSGVVPLGLLGMYAFWRRLDHTSPSGALRDAAWFAVGAVPGILALWTYQWIAFGEFLYPAQHHMPASTTWSDQGYQGFSVPTWELTSLNLFDPRYGLFVTAPILMLGLAAPFLRRRDAFLARRELLFCLGFFLALTLFFASVQYSRLQYITGVRYMLPAVPFLLLPALVVLRALPRRLAGALGVGSIVFAWFQAMARIREQEPSILVATGRILRDGLQLPAFETLERMGGRALPLSAGTAALIMLGALIAVVALIWTVRRRPPLPD